MQMRRAALRLLGEKEDLEALFERLQWEFHFAIRRRIAGPGIANGDNCGGFIEVQHGVGVVANPPLFRGVLETGRWGARPCAGDQDA